MNNILNYFIEEPEREFHIRELAKITKKSPATISKYLKNLKKENLLISRSKYNHLLFKANNENQNFKDIKRYNNIKKLRNSGLIEYLIERYNQPQAIILFGSFAKGENINKSDIDILIITHYKTNLDLERYEKKLNHKIQLFTHSNQEIERMKLTNKELINNLVNGINLEGFWELFK